MNVDKATILQFREDINREYNLKGWCHRNSLELAKRLDSIGLDPYLVWGYLEGSGSFDDVEAMEISGQTHFWVECLIEGTPYMIDLYSIDPQYESEVLFRTERPQTYLTPNEDPVHVRYKSWLTESHLLNYEDYQVLRDKGIIKSEPFASLET